MRKLFAIFFCLTSVFSTGAIAEDKILRIGNDLEPTTILPYNMTLHASVVLGSSLYESLTCYSKEGELVGGLAASWENLDESTRFRFLIRPGLVWSDGVPITADTIRDSFLGQIGNPKANAGSLISLVVGASAFRAGEITANEVGISTIGGNIIEFRLKTPARYFPDLLSEIIFAPVPTHLFDVYDPDFDPGITTDWAFSGPFMLTEVAPGKYTALRNPSYHDVDNVFIDGFELSVTALDIALIYDLMKNGELHIARVNAPKDSVYAQSYLEDYIINLDPLIGHYVVMNTTRPPFDNEDVRQAIYMATDPDLGGLIDQFDSYSQMTNMIPPAIHNYPGDVVPEWLNWSVEARLEHARAVLAKHGYGEQNPLKATFAIVDHPTHYAVGNALKAMWTRANIEVEFVVRDLDGHYEAMEEGEFDIGRDGWIPDYNDPHDFLALFESNNPHNYGRWNNETYDQLIHDAQRTDNLADTQRLQREALAITQTSVPRIPIYRRTDYMLVSPAVQGAELLSSYHRSYKWFDIAEQ